MGQVCYFSVDSNNETHISNVMMDPELVNGMIQLF
jgi:hypothetical protein